MIKIGGGVYAWLPPRRARTLWRFRHEMSNTTEVIQKVGNLEIFGIRVFQTKVNQVAPNSGFTQAVNQINTTGLLPGENCISSEQMSQSLSAVESGAEKVNDFLSGLDRKKR